MNALSLSAAVLVIVAAVVAAALLVGAVAAVGLAGVATGGVATGALWRQPLATGSRPVALSVEDLMGAMTLEQELRRK